MTRCDKMKEIQRNHIRHPICTFESLVSWFAEGELGENLSRPRPIPPGEPKPAIDSEKSEKQRKIKKDIGKQWQVQTLLHYRPVD